MVAPVAVVSDTHGLVRPELVEAVALCGRIIHAGDVGSRAVLDELARVAPVVAVRGNVDGAWASSLPLTEVVEVGGLLVYVLHNLDDLDLDPLEGGFSAVIYGHSHRPSITTRSGVLYLNPGSAGPRRFDLPVSMALLHVEGGRLSASLVDLSSAGPPPLRGARRAG